VTQLESLQSRVEFIVACLMNDGEPDHAERGFTPLTAVKSTSFTPIGDGNCGAELVERVHSHVQRLKALVERDRKRRVAAETSAKQAQQSLVHQLNTRSETEQVSASGTRWPCALCVL
jgi:hypothetical protein